MHELWKPLGAICLLQDESERIFQNVICLNCLPEVLRKWDLENMKISMNPEHYKIDYTQRNSMMDCNRLIEWIEENNPTLKVRIGIKKGDKE